MKKFELYINLACFQMKNIHIIIYKRLTCYGVRIIIGIEYKKA